MRFWGVQFLRACLGNGGKIRSLRRIWRSVFFSKSESGSDVEAGGSEFLAVPRGRC